MDDPRARLPGHLADLAARLAAADDLRSGLQAAAWACDGAFPFYRVALALPARRSGRYHVAAAWARRPEEELEGYDFAIRGHPLEPVVREGVALVRIDPCLDQQDPVLSRLFREEGKLEELGVPLDLGGRRGLLVFASRSKDGFGPAARGLASDVGTLLGLWARAWAGPDSPHAMREQYESLLEGALDGVAVLQGGRTVYANPSFCEIFGVSTAGATPFAQLLSPESREAFQGAVEALRRRSRVLPRLEVESRPGTGDPLHLDVGLQRILYRGEAALLLQVHNASQRAEREREVRRSHERLDALLHTLAHDIRTPLATVVGFSELLLERGASLSGQKVAEMTGIIARSGRSLRELVEGLLEYSSLGKGGAPIVEVSLESVLRTVEGELEGALARSGGRLEYLRLPRAVRGRPPEIARVFKNLVENGLKYAHADRPPVVRVECQGQVGEHLVFAVEDNGVGIAPERLSRVFELFRRGEGGGAGVGLAIVERIVQGYGGRVWVESRPGEGSCFFVTLPRWAGAPAPAPAGGG